jgi:Mn-dependent DtxR family transcriptional regulator
MVGLEVQKPTGIAGGFVLVDVPWLMAAWTACRSAPLGLADFRSLLAAREMVARRCLASEGRAVTYDVPELARLLGVTEKRAKASLRRLQAAGLIVWNESAISFPEIGDRGRDQVLDTIGQGRGSLAIPRRILRVLSGGARPTLIATTLGILLRGLSRRKGGFDGRGRVKAGWIAQTFGVDQRRVKQARKDLVALGWIKLEPDGQRAMNRWGRAFRIDLAWDRVGSSGPSLPPPPAADRPEIATPSVHQEPLPEREENQEPASGGPAGVEVSGPAGEPEASRDRPAPADPSPRRTAEPGGQDRRPSVGCESPAPTSPRPSSLPAPQLDNVRVEDLREVGRTLQLHDQAVARKLADPSEAGRLRFVALAEHARVVGTVNPGGLFACLVRRGFWHFATLDDEDGARRKLREHLHGRPLVVDRPRLERPRACFASMVAAMSPKPRVASELSEDARLVREIRTATIRAGIFRDPWPAFQARNPGWDRGRWDRALGELGLV